jgi:hypothetical protein
VRTKKLLLCLRLKSNRTQVFSFQKFPTQFHLLFNSRIHVLSSFGYAIKHEICISFVCERKKTTMHIFLIFCICFVPSHELKVRYASHCFSVVSKKSFNAPCYIITKMRFVLKNSAAACNM